jgi:hypothetical protein
MKPSKLEYRNVAGAGHQIKAHIGEEVPCVEFRLRGDVPQTVMEGRTDVLIGYSPFIQFSPTEWGNMLDKLYQEMVDAWNEKHSNGGNK